MVDTSCKTTNGMKKQIKKGQYEGTHIYGNVLKESRNGIRKVPKGE